VSDLLFVYETKNLEVPNLASKQIVEALGMEPGLVLIDMGVGSTWGKIKEPKEIGLEFLLPDLDDSVAGKVYRIEGDLGEALALLDRQTGLFYERRLIELNIGEDTLAEGWGYLASEWVKEGRVSFKDYYANAFTHGWAC